MLYFPVAGFRPFYLSNAACRASHSQIIFTTSAIYHSFVVTPAAMEDEHFSIPWTRTEL